MPGIAPSAGTVGEGTAKAPAHPEVHSSHNLLTEGAVAKRQGKKKMQLSKNDSVFRKEEAMLMGSHCPLNPHSFPSINNKIKLTDEAMWEIYRDC